MKNKTTLTDKLADSFSEFASTGVAPFVRISEHHLAKIETGGSFGRTVKVVQSSGGRSLTMDVSVYGCQPSDGTRYPLVYDDARWVLERHGCVIAA